MEIRAYDHLSEEASAIRRAVFMEEQGFVDEFDEVDNIATHIVLLDGREAVATCRIFPGDDPGEYVVGRLAVTRGHRGSHLGARTLAAAEDEAARRGATSVVLHAQARASGFYESQGYERFGEQDLDEGCPHVWMRKRLA